MKYLQAKKNINTAQSAASLQGSKTSLHECPGYKIKLLGIRNTLSLTLLPGLLWPGVVAPERVLSMGQIELSAI